MQHAIGKTGHSLFLLPDAHESNTFPKWQYSSCVIPHILQTFLDQDYFDKSNTV